MVKKKNNQPRCLECGRILTHNTGKNTDYYQYSFDEVVDKDSEKLCFNCFETQNAYAILADCGVPFDSDGTPLGIW